MVNLTDHRHFHIVVLTTFDVLLKQTYYLQLTKKQTRTTTDFLFFLSFYQITDIGMVVHLDIKMLQWHHQHPNMRDHHHITSPVPHLKLNRSINSVFVHSCFFVHLIIIMNSIQSKQLNSGIY